MQHKWKWYIFIYLPFVVVVVIIVMLVACTLGYVVPEVGAYLWHRIVPLIELSTSCSEAGALITDLCQALIYLFLQK